MISSMDSESAVNNFDDEILIDDEVITNSKGPSLSGI